MTPARFARLAAVVGLVLLAADTNAQSIDDARAAFDEGRFLEAADLAEAVGTSTGFALAAQSLAVYGYHLAGEEERQGSSNVQCGSARRPCAPIRPTPRRISSSPMLLADMRKPSAR